MSDRGNCNPSISKTRWKAYVCRLAVGIDHLWALVGAFVLTTEGVNSPKMEFFDIVAHLKPGLAELSYTLDQGGQTCVHRRFCPLSLDDWGEQKFVLP
jgi:hypothetical protein